MSFLRQSFGYMLGTILLAASSLMMIRSMVGAAGGTAWAEVATGQAVGGIAATVVGYGWALTGPSAIGSTTDPWVRWCEYAGSMSVKGLLFPIAALVAISVSVGLTGCSWYSALGALNASMLGLASDWLYVGEGKAYALLLFETMPRCLFSAAAILVMHLGADAALGLAVQSMGVAIAVLASGARAWLLYYRNRKVPVCQPRAGVLHLLRTRGAGLISYSMNSLFLAVPVVSVNLLAPSALAVFALNDKLQKQAIAGVQPMVAVVQSEVVRVDFEARIERIRRLQWLVWVVALGLFLGLCSTGAYVFDWMGKGQISVGRFDVATFSGIVVLAFLDSVLARAFLASLNRTSSIAWTSGVGFGVGLVLIFALGALLGYRGVLLGVFATYLVRVFGLCVILSRAKLET